MIPRETWQKLSASSLQTLPSTSIHLVSGSDSGNESQSKNREGIRDAFALENANIPGNHSRRRASLRWLQAENRNQRRSSSLTSRGTLYPLATIASDRYFEAVSTEILRFHPVSIVTSAWGYDFLILLILPTFSNLVENLNFPFSRVFVENLNFRTFAQMTLVFLF